MVFDCFVSPPLGKVRAGAGKSHFRPEFRNNLERLVGSGIYMKASSKSQRPPTA